MIVELGHFALLLALCVACVQGASVLLCRGLDEAEMSARRLATRAAHLQMALLLLAFLALAYAFYVSDFSVALVHANSHLAKPTIYKLAGVWGNHEGSMLLWVLMLAAYGAAFARFSRRLPDGFVGRSLMVQGWLGMAFLAFLIFTSNPFLRLDPAPFEGRGLTPILQDPALAAHPPLLYGGYVGFSLCFAFAIAALMQREVGRDWAQWVRPWILLAWISLTLGIALGSFWAYYELGWGGFWFWDPVENASLMPWLSGTALLHSALVMEKRRALVRWTLLLAILTFALSLSGTFLVRSGVLTSVHAFANDPARGVFILAILALFTGGGLALYAHRLPGLAAERGFVPVSREGFLLLNNVFLATATVTVFLGTIYPLVLDALALGKISVGAPYFNAVFAPLTLPFLLLMPLAPLMGWRQAMFMDGLQKLGAAALAALLVTGGFLLLRGDAPILPLLLLAASLWLVFGALTDLAVKLRPWMAGRMGARAWPSAGLFAAPLAHAGLGVMLVGVIAASVWRVEKVVAAAPGTRVDIAGYSLRYDGVRDLEGPNYRAETARLVYLNGSMAGAQLFPERRFYQAERGQTTEAAITKNLAGHLYAVIGEPVDDKRVLRIWYHPLVALIWLGGVLMALGGSFALRARIGKQGGAA